MADPDATDGAQQDRRLSVFHFDVTPEGNAKIQHAIERHRQLLSIPPGPLSFPDEERLLRSMAEEVLGAPPASCS